MRTVKKNMIYHHMSLTGDRSLAGWRKLNQQIEEFVARNGIDSLDLSVTSFLADEVEVRLQWKTEDKS